MVKLPSLIKTFQSRKQKQYPSEATTQNISHFISTPREFLHLFQTARQHTSAALLFVSASAFDGTTNLQRAQACHRSIPYGLAMFECEHRLLSRSGSGEGYRETSEQTVEEGTGRNGRGGEVVGGSGSGIRYGKGPNRGGLERLESQGSWQAGAAAGETSGFGRAFERYRERGLVRRESFSPSTAALRVYSLGRDEGCWQRESWAPEHHTLIHQNESRQGLEYRPLMSCQQSQNKHDSLDWFPNVEITR
ncbi:hypothetical protein HCDG_07917 [Histoplasma capsulatum H143]|uniref:Uncharacterized protein n=1 Tax=Ajellomyces capsulatus (strain H143) TaxID=544712 RepID=C6HNY6_AJECH|nr:hypothetical protein HCDG_07917 [Histoplasma capsulatum H143]